LCPREHERLQARMDQFFERFESTLKQALRVGSDEEAVGKAGTLIRYLIGSLHQLSKSGFTKKPTESLAAQRRYQLVLGFNLKP
jgi:TetR/AcrR family transcriptional regulator